MTEQRKYEIAFLVMRDYMQIHGFKPNSTEVDRLSANDAGFITIHDEAKPPTIELRKLINGLLTGDEFNGQVLRYGALAWAWLILMWSNTKLCINTTSLRREVGNIAKRLEISEVQTIEFFRLLMTDVVNEALCQCDDEVPLEKQG